MAEATVRFRMCFQDSPELGSDNEYMVSKVVFDIEADDRAYPHLVCYVKQPAGVPVEDAPLEVSRPHGYDGSLNYAPFRQAVENYYRASFCRGGRAEGVRMYNNRAAIKQEVRVLYSRMSHSW